MTSILAAFLLLGICIFFHELGHFLIGKLVGVQAKIFSIGYGKGIWYKKIGKTIYQITPIPLGGYVQFYGDNLLKKYSRFKKGDFLGAHPLKRILIAFGGPGFSILLGFLVIFILIASGWQPTTNKIMMMTNHDFLKTGDQIISINGKPTSSFEKIAYEIGLSPSLDANITVNRNNEIFHQNVELGGGDGPRYIPGLRPFGKAYLMITDPGKQKNSVFQEGDKIIQANGVKIKDLDHLKQILDSHPKKHISITVSRKDGNLFNPSKYKEIKLQAPLFQREIMNLNNLIDLQTGVNLEDRKIGTWQKEIWQNIRIGSESFSDWNNLKSYLKSGERSFYIGSVHVKGKINYEKRNLFMVSIQPVIEAEKATMSRDFLSLFSRTFDQTIFITKATLLGIYRIIQGKLSFEKSISGPIKIIAIAAKSVDAGWDHYWLLLAQITIVLGIMNLLPIPVLDGGHIIFYLIEYLYKPLSPKVIAGSIRFGMILLLVLGVYVIGLDIWDVFVRGIFQ